MPSWHNSSGDTSAALFREVSPLVCLVKSLLRWVACRMLAAGVFVLGVPPPNMAGSVSFGLRFARRFARLTAPTATLRGRFGDLLFAIPILKTTAHEQNYYAHELGLDLHFKIS
jgi:hypothetical protein